MNPLRKMIFFAAAPVPCNYGNFTCDSNICLPLYMKCDDKYQCYDQSDEQFCDLNNKTYQVNITTKLAPHSHEKLR